MASHPMYYIFSTTNKYFFIALLVLSVLSCENKVDPKKSLENTNNPKGISLKLKFKKGTNITYFGKTRINLSEFNIKGISPVLQKYYQQFTDNKGIDQLLLIINQEVQTQIQKVHQDGSADIDSITKNITIQELKINGISKKTQFINKFPTDHKNPGQPVSMLISNSKKLLKIYNPQKTIHLGNNVINDLMDLVNSYQQLPEKNINLGDSWNYNAGKKIPLKKFFSPNLKWDGFLKMDVNYNNTFEKMDKQYFHFTHGFKGRIIINLLTHFGDGEVIIYLNGTGKSTLDQTTGLESKIYMLTDLKIEGELKTSSQYKALLGNPELFIKGQIKYTSGLNPVKK